VAAVAVGDQAVGARGERADLVAPGVNPLGVGDPLELRQSPRELGIRRDPRGLVAGGANRARGGRLDRPRIGFGLEQAGLRSPLPR
jgi:hypothetical protein